jgi:hypothetical protein
MQKKMISRFLGLLFILNVAACSSARLSELNPVNSSINGNDIFVDPAIARYMGTADRIKLQTLVATAEPQQMAHWYSATTSERFEFTSLGIYVNAQGQGCRNYRLVVNRGLLAHPSFNCTTCRDSQGVWKVTTPE